MNIIPIPAFTDNYIWLLINDSEKSAICIDPGEDKPVLNYLQKNDLHLDAIFLTHHHFDHTGGVAGLVHYSPETPVYGPEDARIPFVSHYVKDKDLIYRSGQKFEIISIPGHTASHISYYEPVMGWLFCGDTLFSAGCGRVFDSSCETLYASLMKLAALPDTTAVYCAHEYTAKNLRFAALVEPHNPHIQNLMTALAPDSCSLPSTMGREKLINPFLRTSEPEVQEYALRQGCSDLTAFNIFRQLRADKDNF